MENKIEYTVFESYLFPKEKTQMFAAYRVKSYLYKKYGIAFPLKERIKTLIGK